MDALINRCFSKPVAHVLRAILFGIRSAAILTLLFTLFYIRNIHYGFIGYDNLLSFFLFGIGIYIVGHI